MNNVLPPKELLEKNTINSNSNYYNLSKLIYKKDNINKLLFPLGIDKDNEKYYIDFQNKTSMFIEGETGSGKSVFLNSIIISLLLKNTKDDLKFIFIDPRDIELNLYNGIPHLDNDSFSTPKEGLKALNNVLELIEKRKDLFVSKKVNNIDKYNSLGEEKIPQIIIIVDEAVDLFYFKETEEIINRILPDGYKYGVHIIVATSSYLKNTFSDEVMRLFNYVITFDLANKEQANLIKIEDSDLLSVAGDALIKCRGNKIVNVQTPYVSLDDINEVVNFIKANN